jgi:hypothetical protein
MLKTKAGRTYHAPLKKHIKYLWDIDCPEQASWVRRHQPPLGSQRHSVLKHRCFLLQHPPVWSRHQHHTSVIAYQYHTDFCGAVDELCDFRLEQAR